MAGDRLAERGAAGILYISTQPGLFFAPVAMLIYVPAEQYAAVLDAVAGEALAEARLERPPVDAFAVARTLGITVAEDVHQSSRGRYVRLRVKGRRPRPTILLRPDPRRERRHWALAHEIGEHLAHRVYRLLDLEPGETSAGSREAVANQLAGRLLVPTVWYREDALEFDWNLTRLKKRYATASHELLARRMLDLPPPVIVTIVDDGQLYFRRSNVPGRVPPLTATEKTCRRDAHRQGRTVAARCGAARVQAWPIHEPGWKREILRTEVDLVPW